MSSLLEKWNADSGATRTPLSKIWVYLLICFSCAILSCSLMHYLVWAIHSTDLCPYLCPTLLSTEPLTLPLLLKQGFAAQASLLKMGTNMFGITDTHLKLFISRLIIAPTLEEFIYRGPLFLLRKFKLNYVWYGLAIVLCLLFVLSHNSAGLSYVPLTVLAVGSAWLIVKTGRFWPCVLLHFLYNFQVVSRPFYDSFMWGDKW